MPVKDAKTSLARATVLFNHKMYTAWAAGVLPCPHTVPMGLNGALKVGGEVTLDPIHIVTILSRQSTSGKISGKCV